MKKALLAILAVVGILAMLAAPVAAQEYGMQRYLIGVTDEAGNANKSTLAVTVYGAGTETSATVYSSAQKAAISTTLDAITSGTVSFWGGASSYDVQISDGTQAVRFMGVLGTTGRLVLPKGRIRALGQPVAVTAGALPDGAYGFEIGSSITGATKSEGAAAYLHTTLTGDIDGPTYNLGSWLDVTGGTPTASGPLAAIDCGIYATADADLSTIWTVGLQIQTMVHATAAPAKHYMMRFNTDESGDTPDGWFQAANPACVAFTASAATDGTKVGAIKVSIVGYDDCYFRLYDDYK